MQCCQPLAIAFHHSQVSAASAKEFANRTHHSKRALSITSDDAPPPNKKLFQEVPVFCICFTKTSTGYEV